MYIYNITINIADEVADKWLFWMRKTYIPKVLSKGKFDKAKLIQVLVNEEMGGKTYSVQFFVSTKAKLAAHYKEDATALRNEMMQLFPNQFVEFSTELALIETFTN